MSRSRHLDLLWPWFRHVWKGSPGALALILVFSVLSAVLYTTIPWLWQYIVDEVRGDADVVRIQELGVWVAVVGLAHALLYMVLQGTRSVMNAKIEWRARTRVFGHLSELDPAFYRRWRAGDLVTRLSDDGGDKISWFLCSGVFRTFEAALIVVACLCAMMMLSWKLTLLLIIPLPILVGIQAAAQGLLGARYLRVQQAISGINDELTTTFSGVRIVQACGLGGPARRRFLEAADAQRAAEIDTAVVQQGVFFMYGNGWQAAIVALLIFGGGAVIDGDITLGQYVAFEGFVMTLVWPMFDVGMFLSKYKQTGVALERLQQLLDEEPPDVGGVREPADGALEMDGVRVDAEDGTTLLEGIDLQVGVGELVAVVGRVGSGKSVLMQTLAGLRHPAQGTFRLGGVDVAELEPGARRQGLGFVPQDPVLLSDTILQNIGLGRPLEGLDDALRISRLEQDLPAFPDGLETEVGERGLSLSGGQQQRVALARALVGSIDVLLLDDATAALDADTETQFWREVESVLPRVAAVVVTHRVATIERADRVIVLHQGRVAQAGEHAELVSVEGPYRAIYGRYRDEAVLAGAGAPAVDG